MIVSRPLNDQEPDLLLGLEAEAVSVLALDGTPLLSLRAPEGGWTHEALELASLEWGSEWDAYLGERWIGSSEV